MTQFRPWHDDEQRADIPEQRTAVPLVVDCDHCAARGAGCSDCMVSFLLGGPPEDVVFDNEEQRALDVLSAAGLIPPLRMVRSESQLE